jgi:hypothetical protein
MFYIFHPLDKDLVKGPSLGRNNIVHWRGQNRGWGIPAPELSPFSLSPASLSSPLHFEYDIFLSINYHQVCKQLEVLGNLEDSEHSSETLRDAMAVAQHHDAVTGTEKQHVAYDYAKRLAMGAEQCKVRKVEILPNLE